MFLGGSVTANYLYIITEYCSRGSLYDIIHSNMDLSWNRQLQMAIDAARGMLYLHERNPKVIHRYRCVAISCLILSFRDLKTSNLLVDKDWNVKG